MKKVLIAYFSVAGKTEKMADYIAEGVRFSGNKAILKKISEIPTGDGLDGYDGYLIGSPTYYRDIPESVKSFLSLLSKLHLEGKPVGTFGSYTHDGGGPAIIFETLQRVNQMEPFELGPFNLKEAFVDTREGIHSCHDYGRVFGENLVS
jgi:flavodoxin